MSFFSDRNRLAAMRCILDHLRETLDARFSVFKKNSKGPSGLPLTRVDIFTAREAIRRG